MRGVEYVQEAATTLFALHAMPVKKNHILADAVAVCSNSFQETHMFTQQGCNIPRFVKLCFADGRAASVRAESDATVEGNSREVRARVV